MDTVLYIGAGAEIAFLASSTRRAFRVETPAAALSFLSQRGADVIVIDTRSHGFGDGAGENSSARPFSASPAGELLAHLFPGGRLHAGVQRDRVVGVVSADPAGADAAFHFGTYRVGSVLSAPSREALSLRVDELVAKRDGGRVAICLAGGGIEGLLYEIGVLRALDSFLPTKSVVDLDLFCGISAGAVLGAFLANGVGPDEIARGLAGGSARIEPIKRSELFDPNVREAGQRLSGLVRGVLRGGEGPRGVVSTVARALPSGAFAGKRLREYLKRQLNQVGMSDRFDDLRRPLFVGATDMDTSEAVVFGEDGFRHVPIHKAVRASSALTPFYAPEQIDGRYYIDGAYSRTTNMRVAVRQGATMVILIDPLVPAFSSRAGYVRERGGIYGTMQGLKALVNGRFDKAVRAIREMFPEVSFYLFRPYGDEMRILSGSPMKYFYRREVEEIAFRSTVEKMRGSLSDLTRDFARHGVPFEDPDRGSEPPARVGGTGLGV